MATPTDLDEANRIVEASGNTFHAKVLRFLGDEDWAVRISPYYSDAASGKQREVDLIAEKSFPAATTFFGEAKGDIRVRLFIECKYTKHPTVFWMHQQDEESTFKLLERTTHLKRDNVVYTPKHHYLGKKPRRVAKLFASQPLKETEQEQIFKALNQSLNATIALRYTAPFSVQSRRVLHTVNYSLIVCSDFNKFFAVDLESESDPRGISDNFLLEINYAHLNAENKSVAEYFLVDMVSFEGLGNFLHAVNDDVGAMGYMLSD